MGVQRALPMSEGGTTIAAGFRQAILSTPRALEFDKSLPRILRTPVIHLEAVEVMWWGMRGTGHTFIPRENDPNRIREG
jgi:hypothetical protein